ncbi:MAG: O-antigen ligase family protein [Terriglobales bacterium]
MNTAKLLLWAGIAASVAFVLFVVHSHLQYFGDVSFLASILLIEIVIACLWKFDSRFFLLLMVSFLWAGMALPMAGVWTGGRWVVLSIGALVGFVIWMNAPRKQFKSIHLLSFFCVGAAFVSASVSPYAQMASFKALSLLLLFLYCSSGVRVAAVGREPRFFNGLLLACEIATAATAICYFGLGQSIWGNPNALGAALSIGVFPILLWGWLTTDGPLARLRRLAFLLLCVFLIFYSMARAGIVSMIVVTLIFCICLRQYKLLTKITALALAAVALSGMFAPLALDQTISDLKDLALYKGHKEKGLLGSRKTPWENTISSIKEHPWFGTGYGTSPTGEDPGFQFGRFASSAETVREHGSSYMTIAEWVGLLGVVPFLALLGLTVSNVYRVCSWMRKTSNPRHYSIPLAMVVLAGLVHAGFEDWMFAVGSYTSVYFWPCAFLLADLMPAAVTARSSAAFARIPRPIQRFEVAVPNR